MSNDNDFDLDPEQVELIARGLPALPHPDGTPLIFPQHADQFLAETEEEQAAKSAMNKMIAQAFLNYLHVNGQEIASSASLAQPQRFGEHTVVTGHCATCAGVLFTATVTQDGKFSIPPRLINPDCESRHGAL
ncbi:MAG: hypothetical protein ACPGVG_18105 [Mycobacterium sp.]